MKLYTVSQIRELETLAMESQGISEATLMQTAGETAFQQCHSLHPSASRYLIVCGPGNNGGDGYVFARAAKLAGFTVSIKQLASPPEQGAAHDAYLACEQANIPIDNQATLPLPDEYDVLVDAIFGIGLQRPITGTFATIIKAMNTHSAPIFAIDTPSGVNADNGKTLGETVRALHTMTFIGNKLGFYLGEAREYAGEIIVSNCQISDDEFAKVMPIAERLDWQDPQFHLSPRPRTAHKGDFGHVLVVGGNYGYAGAAAMSAFAAARAGAGLVSVATRPEHATNLFTQHPELMAHAMHDPNEIDKLIERATVLVVGPGLDKDEWAKRLAEKCFQSTKPLVVDADALGFLPNYTPREFTTIITPHPGEAGRLLGTDSKAVQADRYQAIQDLLRQFNAITILKGANTLIQAPGEVLKVCDAGNPGMATGGMGDVLSGVIAGLLAQGSEPWHATQMAVLCHAIAGDRASRAHGQRGLVATDLLPHIQDLVNDNYA